MIALFGGRVSFLVRPPFRLSCALIIVRFPRTILLLPAACGLAFALPIFSQPLPAPTPTTDPSIALTLPENLELKSLVDYVSQRLGFNVLYDESINNQKITLKAPAEIPRSSLEPLLESALRSKGFTLVPADVPGWKRIVPAGGDSMPSAETHTYALKYAAPDRVDKLMKELLGPDARRFYSSASDADGGLLVVTAPTAVQQRVASLVDSLDHPTVEARSPIKFYKLENATAADVLDTIRGIEGDSDSSGDNTSTAGPPPPTQSLAQSLPQSSPLASSLGTTAGSGLLNGLNSTGNGFGGSLSPALPSLGGTAPANTTPSSLNSSASTDRSQSHIQSVHSKYGIVTADVNTNSIIVIGDADQQRFYEGLIPVLDKRRPQVLIEATLISIDTTNEEQLGVEIGVKSGSGATQILTFSSFGLSTVDAKTGQLAISPGNGFNGTILNSDVASAVVHALAIDTRARVLSSPRILVNDNADGTLNSTDNVPYSSINASNTVSTTSLGGTVAAGTIIKVTPHISEGDHLSLHYDVTLSNFTGTSSDGLPPPTKQDELSSDVTIPDGNTIIVGGLNTQSDMFTRDAIPLLGQIPILGELFSNHDKTRERATLFVFLRPVILRDDQFRDLKFLSDHALEQAKLPGNYPASDPLPIR